MVINVYVNRAEKMLTQYKEMCPARGKIGIGCNEF